MTLKKPEPWEAYKDCKPCGDYVRSLEGELEMYKKALEYACYRLESLDMGSDYSWKARTWKKVILEKVKEIT